jgi:hypothetical protein
MTSYGTRKWVDSGLCGGQVLIFKLNEKYNNDTKNHP